MRYVLVSILICGIMAHGYSNDKEREIIEAISENDFNSFIRIIEEGYDYKQLYNDSCLGHGYTLLHISAIHNSVKISEYLIQKGLDVNYKSEEGYAPLHFAIMGGGDTVKLLIEKGAQINIKDNKGATPLHAAAKNYENTRIVEYLIKKGADVNARDIYGCTPLHWICTNECDDLGKSVALVLLDNGAYRDIRKKTRKEWDGYPSGSTPADIAKISGYPEWEVFFNEYMKEKKLEKKGCLLNLFY
ncbi:MAG: ankyrin repeat domain-containing protein [Spirochaetota bacterium]